MIVKALLGILFAAFILVAAGVSLVALIASEIEARKVRACPTRDPRR